MSPKEFRECKHPTVWIETEKGLIDEVHCSVIVVELLSLSERASEEHFLYSWLCVQVLVNSILRD